MKEASEPSRAYRPAIDRNATLGSRTSTTEARRLLIVDDSRIVRDLLVELVRGMHLDFRISAAADGDSALRLFDGERPEVVLLDVDLPKGSGFDLLADMKLRQPTCVIGMLTSYDCPEFRENALRLGAAFFFGKTTDFGRIPGVLRLLAGGRG